MTRPVLLWLRQDLRLADQAALLAAAAEGPVVPVYVLDDEGAGTWAIGAAQRWWLHFSLLSLADDLAARGSRLVLRRGRAVEQLALVAAEAGATRVHAIRHYEPWWIAAEQALAARLDLQLHDGNQLLPPRDVVAGSGEPYRIYGPFWRALSSRMPPRAPVPGPGTILAPDRWPQSAALDDWQLRPRLPDWAAHFGDDWAPGEAGAQQRLAGIAGKIARYAVARNLPAEEGTSRLSPHLHFGELSPATVWHAVADDPEAEKIQRELAWRDFATGTIYRFPDLGDTSARPRYARLPVRTGAAADRDFTAWSRGQTGYPIVDAGMRQLWTTGWMHNRVRMITASFLVKHLLIDWRRGARWFWDTLIDADYGNNSVNWQWIAGSGHDASIFSRIMAPLAQSAKFSSADYIRRWVPELAGLSDEVIHDPHGAAVAPANYVPMLIGHREARERALAAGRMIRSEGA